MGMEIRKIKMEEVTAISVIGANAFPGGGTTVEGVCKWIEGTVDQKPDDVFYGAFIEDRLVGGTRYLDYQMNLMSQTINLGGLGFVCVDLLHKKEKIAKEMMLAFLKHYRAQKVNMVMLYPFNIPFYKKMGFGCGTTMYKFRITPISFPSYGSKEHLSFAQDEDNQLMLECYNRVAAKTNGMIFRNSLNLSKDVKVIVYKEAGQVRGYMTFSFEEAKEGYDYLVNLRLHGLLYEDARVLEEFSTFLYSQSDQVQRIVYITQDDSLKYFLTDPTNGQYGAFKSLYLESYEAASGAMYRISDVEGIFKELSGHNFAGQDCKLKLTVRDSFIPENDGSLVIEFDNGKIQRIDSVGEYDVEMTLDIADLSALIVGGINLKGLLKYGLVTLSNAEYIDVLEYIFKNDKPYCVTYF